MKKYDIIDVITIEKIDLYILEVVSDERIDLCLHDKAYLNSPMDTCSSICTCIKCDKLKYKPICRPWFDCIQKWKIWTQQTVMR
jgi:hypothetical protein